jgi:hypothetical protein
MSINITLRMTKRSIPLISKIKSIAKNREFAPTLLDIIELGLKSYESGNRIIENTVVKMPSVYETGERTVYSIDNEVAETLYSSLSGAIINLEYQEEDQPSPDQNKLSYYLYIRKALNKEKSNFCSLTDAEIKQAASKLSTILKSFTGERIHDHQIIEQNQNFFDQLIQSSGVLNA